MKYILSILLLFVLMNLSKSEEKIDTYTINSVAVFNIIDSVMKEPEIVYKVLDNEQFRAYAGEGYFQENYPKKAVEKMELFGQYRINFFQVDSYLKDSKLLYYDLFITIINEKDEEILFQFKLIAEGSQIILFWIE